MLLGVAAGRLSDTHTLAQVHAILFTGIEPVTQEPLAMLGTGNSVA